VIINQETITNSYSDNKNQGNALFVNFILIKNSTFFG